MDPVLRLGAVNLGLQDLTVTKSVVKLRPACWAWSEAPRGADLCLVDVEGEGYPGRLAGLDRTRLVALSGPAGQAESFALRLAKPLKAVQLLRLLDAVAATLAPSPAPPASAARSEPRGPEDAGQVRPVVPAPGGPATEGDEHPWRGRRVLLTRSPNLARFPVSAEMLPWLEALRRAPVSYDELLAALPMDAAMVDAVLDEAAKSGHLRDADGLTLPQLPRRPAAGFWTRFRK
ncbi:MAG: hypothetical protein JNK22_11450 [Rhodocyclaceae bacterium]|nr:hypothetical protein [Rhodocyclaceae bacterium]